MANLTDSVTSSDHPDRPPRDAGRSRLGERLTAALSLGLHGALVLMLVNVTAVPGNLSLPDSVSIDIVQLAPPSPKEDVKPEPEPEPPKPSPAPAPKPKPPPRPLQIPKPVAELPPTQQKETSPGSGEPDAAAMIAAPPQPSSPPPAQSGGNIAPDDSLRLYGQAVWARIVAHKPRGVRLPGTATVTFAISRDGTLLSAIVSASNGSATLDRVALDTVRTAAPFPPPPPHATATQLTFSVPFHFR